MRSATSATSGFRGSQIESNSGVVGGLYGVVCRFAGLKIQTRFSFLAGPLITLYCSVALAQTGHATYTASC